MRTCETDRLTARRRGARLILIGLAVCMVGCRTAHTVRDPEFAEVASAALVNDAACEPISEAGIAIEPRLAGPHAVDEYVSWALAQNPEIHAKRKRADAAAMRVPQASALEDPMLDVTGYPFYPYVPQAVGGRSTYEIMASQQIPWAGKLRTRAAAAAAEAAAACAELAATELEIVEQVKRAYYELYLVQVSTDILRQNRALVEDFAAIAEMKYRAGAVNQQDVLRARLEVSNIDAQLLQLEQQLHQARARLARLLHAPPDTPVEALPTLAVEQIPIDLERLYALAIEARPDLDAQLAEIRRDRLNVDLARLQYFPDLTLRASWGDMTTDRAMSPMADGIGMIGVGFGANVPIYRKRLDAGVREAEAQTVASAREYDARCDKAREEIKDLVAQLTSQEQILALFDAEIIPRAEQTLAASTSAYRAGGGDILMLIDNWRRLLEYRVGQQRLEVQMRQTLASLERSVGGASLGGAAEMIPIPPNGSPTD